MTPKKFLSWITLLLILISSVSCEDYLADNVNKGAVGDDAQWASEGNADIFLNALYGQLTAMHNTPDYLDSFTDDNDGGIYWRSWRWRQGIVGPSNDQGLPMGEFQGGSFGSFANWTMTYTRIRRCNLFIQKVTENPAGTFSPEWSAKRIDEARFLRAYWYAMLWQHVGGLPIITKVLSNQDGTDIYYPRSTFEETFDFIVSELDEIIANDVLPVKYNAGNPDAGRATLGAAVMVKGWVQLYAASPLFNSGSYVLPDPDNLVHFATADPQRWADAAATFKYFMDNYTEYDLFPEMSKFWYVENEYNEGVIWDRQHVAGTSGQLRNNIDQYGGPVYILGVYHTWGNYNPTQELVDTYRMANGKRITDPTSGYDPQHPYVGREQRFYDFIVYDGAPYKQDWMPRQDTIYTRINKVKKEDNEIDFATGDVSNTGYYFKKKLNNLAPEGGAQSGQNYVYYRFAEVLLGYAEAQNEAVGPDASVYEAVNRIRERASTNLPPLDPGLSKEEMRQEIRDQRRIEFAFEAKRFYDVIRWKIAEDVLTVDLHGMKITNESPDDNSGDWIYEPVPLNHPHVFTPKMYMNPIPQTVRDANTKIKQNPGYL